MAKLLAEYRGVRNRQDLLSLLVNRFGCGQRRTSKAQANGLRQSLASCVGHPVKPGVGLMRPCAKVYAGLLAVPRWRPLIKEHRDNSIDVIGNKDSCSKNTGNMVEKQPEKA